jgi:hypothetical protein
VFEGHVVSVPVLAFAIQYPDWLTSVASRHVVCECRLNQGVFRMFMHLECLEELLNPDAQIIGLHSQFPEPNTQCLMLTPQSFGERTAPRRDSECRAHIPTVLFQPKVFVERFLQLGDLSLQHSVIVMRIL